MILKKKQKTISLQELNMNYNNRGDILNNSIKGIISEIERYAVKDGPGIRTVVFFKGCPLKCIWCANPETQKNTHQLMYWPTRCIGCKKCIQICPQKALSWNTTGIMINRSNCISCNVCTNTCNSQALTMSGELKNVEEVLDTIKKDNSFYQVSGGGVTFSGGEATYQKDFLIQLAQRCKDEGISTCIETCGYASQEVYQDLLPYIDYFFFDLKLINEKAHKKYTGVSNKLILSNFCYLQDAGADVTVRIPIIPGINNTESNINDSILFLLEHAPGCHVSLLPYHRLGASKYSKLDMHYSLEELAPPSDEEMQSLKDLFVKHGFYVTIGE